MNAIQNYYASSHVQSGGHSLRTHKSGWKPYELQVGNGWLQSLGSIASKALPHVGKFAKSMAKVGMTQLGNYIERQNAAADAAAQRSGRAEDLAAEIAAERARQELARDALLASKAAIHPPVLPANVAKQQGSGRKKRRKRSIFYGGTKKRRRDCFS